MNDLPGLVEDETEFTYDDHAVRSTPQQHKKIKLAVAQAAALKAEVAQCTATLKSKQKELDRLLTGTIPELMNDCGVLDLTLEGGLRVSVSKSLWAKLPSATTINDEKDPAVRKELIRRRREGIKWLEENGHGSLVQRDFTVEFSKDENERAAEFRSILQNQEELHWSEGENVNANSLSALVREIDANKQAFPRDILGVYEKNNTSITVVKSK